MTYGNEPNLPTYSLAIVRPHGGFACGTASVFAQLPTSDLPFGYIRPRPDEPFEVRSSPGQLRIGSQRSHRKLPEACQGAWREFVEEGGAD